MLSYAQYIQNILNSTIFYAESVKTIEPEIDNPSVISPLLSDIWNFTNTFPEDKAAKLDFHDLLLEIVSPLPIPTLQKILDQAKVSLQTPMSQEKHNPFYTIVLTSLVIPIIINIAFLILIAAIVNVIQIQSIFQIA